MIYRFHPRTVLMAFLLLTGLLYGNAARASDCYGWGGTSLDLSLALSDITLPAGSSLSSVLFGSASASMTPLVCDDNGVPVTDAAWTWLAGTSPVSGPARGGETSGTSLTFNYTRTDGYSGSIGGTDAIYSGTEAFNWNQVTLGVGYTGGVVDISRPVLKAGPVLRGVLTLADGTTRTLNISSTRDVRIIPECVVNSIPSVEFGNVGMSNFATAGSTGPLNNFTVGVTCPVNVQTGGMTLSLSATQTDSTDATLLGNSGTATGIGVEVVDSNGNRVNANGSVAGAGFVTSTSQTWGVRFVRTGTVSAGTVRATATINVTVQ